MSTFDRNSVGRAQGYATGRAEAGVIDQGLRAYMTKVYNLMAIGLAVTGLVAIGAFYMAVTGDAGSAAQMSGGGAAQIGQGMYLTSFGLALYASPLKWVVMLAPLGMVFFLSFRVQNMSVSGAQTAFWVFAALMGLSLSSIFLVFTGQSIARVFFITAASFGALSLYGYTTKKDLSGWGSFLFMGLIGIIIASLVNLFIGSSALQFAISVIGVLVFAGLTAYDTQQIKEMYYVGDDSSVAGKKAIMGALRLYLDFINLFMMLLQLFGNRQ
ncbi:Bax inhibitor-1/YccA family protein [Amorphus orientalis]|uniref:FtsH-binding integral membrane protein n=1 Tax=Amorphus orientalis TaxID=649198 RepID=A0AAE4AUB4_9HYPH|nr:Bax inhibitor-1/YccA family protein [Amorphus orientalis]MDQ0317233.1 FtsH-binding integral membrane protein [Amorphus orientalis]